jgi:hypothetical protein
MNDFRGFDRFTLAVMEVAAPRMLRIYQENKETFNKSIGDDLEWLGFVPLGLRETPSQAAMNRLTSGLIEVRSALDNLTAI